MFIGIENAFTKYSLTAPSVAPRSFEATNISSRQFLISWEAPEAVSINGVLRHYSLSVWEHTSNTVLLDGIEIDPASIESVVSFLAPFVLYECSVSAVTIAQGPSAVLQVRTATEGKL